jgi:putative pyruvate formate lyase activating enzyme
MGEERPITGHYGSGTIFFGNCNLGCKFCQNWEISHEGEGAEMTEKDLSEVMLELQTRRCHNINLVTPTHQMPMILRALVYAVERGLEIPIVYNCGGYESLEALRLLEGIVDIYMPDLKFADSDVSMKWADAPDYFQRAKVAIKEMHRQVGNLVIQKGIARRGLLIRHLVLPEGLAGTKEIARFIACEVSPNTYVNVMEQYYPCYRAKGDTVLGRRITRQEYMSAIEAMIDAGIRWHTDAD